MPTGSSLVIPKTANETVTNSAVLQNDDDFFFSVGEDENWQIMLTLFLVSSASATPNLKFAFTVPAGGAIEAHRWAEGGGLTFVADITTASVVGSVTTAISAHYITARYVGGSVPGVVQLQWAQNIATAEDTQVLRGSWLQAVRMDRTVTA